jgi:pimeloyl-ACP methyl ester carboxylesterase
VRTAGSAVLHGLDHRLGPGRVEDALSRQVTRESGVLLGLFLVELLFELTDDITADIGEARLDEQAAQLDAHPVIPDARHQAHGDQVHCLRVGMVDRRTMGEDLRDDDPATRPDDASQLGKRTAGILEVHEDALGVRRAERRLAEWQAVGIALDEVDQREEPGRLQAFAGLGQECRRMIVADDTSRLSHQTRETWQEHAGAAPELEHGLALLQGEPLEASGGHLADERHERLLFEPGRRGRRRRLVIGGGIVQRGDQRLWGGCVAVLPEFPTLSHRPIMSDGPAYRDQMIDTTEIDARFGVPEHLEHRISAPDGRTLAVSEWGDPKGLPVIQFHGTPGGRIGYWIPEPEIWTRFGLRKLSFDRPGYGESTRLPGRSVVDVVADVVAIAEALRVGRFALTGGSGGGPHILACATLLPDRVVRALASSSAMPFDAPDVDFMAGMNDGNIREFSAAVAGEDALRTMLEPERTTLVERLLSGRSDFLSDDYEMPEADRIEMAKYQKAAAAHLLTALAPGIDGWVDDDLAFVKPWGFDVADCRVPVCLSYGRQDQLTPASHGDWLAAHVPGAIAWVNEATGHLGSEEEMERDLAWLGGLT